MNKELYAYMIKRDKLFALALEAILSRVGPYEGPYNDSMEKVLEQLREYHYLKVPDEEKSYGAM